MGDWLHDFHCFHQKFRYLHSCCTGLIYHYDGKKYNMHSRLRCSRHQSQVYSAYTTTTTTSIPPDAVPVEDLAGSDTILAFCGTDITIQTRPPIFPPTDFPGYISALPHSEQKLLSSINLTDVASLLAQLQEDAHLYIVSDGGAAGDWGSFGALVVNATAIFTSLSGTTKGIEPGSYRTESYGYLAILRLVYHLVTFHQLPPPSFTHTHSFRSLSDSSSSNE
jgi:hypothetical protein